MDTSQHWENVYETKSPDQVSWTQDIPQTSLDFISSFGLDKSAKIIDIGGGDSKLVDHLLALGHTDISVLDISAKALEKAKLRLGPDAEKVKWIQSDVLEFVPSEQYDIWHDRAAFHFLTDQYSIQKYVELTSKSVINHMIIGTFSESGPLKCSGLDISQYTEDKLASVFEVDFKMLSFKKEVHVTPFATQQNFLFGSFMHL